MNPKIESEIERVKSELAELSIKQARLVAVGRMTIDSALEEINKLGQVLRMLEAQES